MVRSLLFAGLVALFHGTNAFSPDWVHPTTRTSVQMSAEVDRRALLANAVAAGLVFLTAANPTPSWALNTFPADNEIVKEQRTVVNKLDINNAPVADYMKLPGMYPAIGGKIANNGPYKSVQDIYKVAELTSEEKGTIKKYEKLLTATPSTGLDTMRGRDPYRRSFNE